MLSSLSLFCNFCDCQIWFSVLGYYSTIYSTFGAFRPQLFMTLRKCNNKWFDWSHASNEGKLCLSQVIAPLRSRFVGSCPWLSPVNHCPILTFFVNSGTLSPPFSIYSVQLFLSSLPTFYPFALHCLSIIYVFSIAKK